MVPNGAELVGCFRLPIPVLKDAGLRSTIAFQMVHDL